ncbi:MAG TPA: sigma-54 dependent transcriptional regulator [Acidisarcina sp.]
MPEKRAIRVLLAIGDPVARSAVEAYLRPRQDCLAMAVAAPPGGPLPAADLSVRIAQEHPDLLLLELASGAELLDSALLANSLLPVLVIIPPHPELAFQAARSGAASILTTPFTDEDLAAKLGPIIERVSAAPAVMSLDISHPPAAALREIPADFPNTFSSSRRMQEIRETIEKVATTSATVLIRGESGVGKEIVARMIFAQSERSSRPFVKVNCAAIPNELLESELFGFEAGAFTGAQRAKPGKFELADGGTMFLDEIGEMHPMLQAKLLHVLQDGEFSRLGSKHDTSVDVRVICATNKQLEQRVADGLFREDLFYRINVVTIHIPPLRERIEEIPALVDYFVDKYSGVYRRSVPPLDHQLMQYLVAYSWPGNIRELENLCKRYVIVGGAAQIMRELQSRRPDRSRRSTDPNPAALAIDAPGPAPTLLEIGRRAAWKAEREAIKQMLAQTQWNRKEAARRLKVSYKALLNKIEQMEREEGDKKENRRA